MGRCLKCGTGLAQGELTCESCGRLLAGAVQVAEMPLEEEASLVFDLLESAGFHPMLAWVEEGGVPHPIERGSSSVPGAGLLPPVTTPFAVYVPEDEEEEARQVLQDAGRDGVTETNAS